jgi:diguanylate cyclase (GGDEF)-like protein
VSASREFLLGIERLARVVSAILARRESGQMYAALIESLAELVPADDIAIWESRDEEIEVVLARGRDADLMRGLRLRHGVGIAGLCALTRRPILSSDAQNDPRARQIPGTDDTPEAILCVPILLEGSLIGVLSLYRASGRGFSADESEITRQFANLAALAIDNARTHERLADLATTDDLTGIANRRRFREELERELAAADRYGGCLSLLLIDLDDFKQVNDTRGHAAGDEVLRAVARALSGRLRRGDLAARLGGDEFAVLLPQSDEAEAAAVIADLKCAIAEETRAIPVTASIGSATFHPGEQVDLLDLADELLYAAKRARPRGRPGGVPR